MSNDSTFHWILIFFAIGVAIGFLLGSETITVQQLMDPVGLVNQVMSGL